MVWACVSMDTPRSVWLQAVQCISLWGIGMREQVCMLYMSLRIITYNKEFPAESPFMRPCTRLLDVGQEGD